jgi:hypothetical protein
MNLDYSKNYVSDNFQLSKFEPPDIICLLEAGKYYI